MRVRRLGWVLFGSIVLSGASPVRASTLLYEITGSDLLGWSVAGLGDVDGDDVPDFAAGAPQAQGPGGEFTAGAVRVLSGADGSPVGALVGTMRGDANSASLGSALARLDDLDGDGVSEILVGAPSVALASAAAGYAVVFSGADGSELQRVVGDTPLERFGDAVASVGDVDGDSVADYIVGAPGTTGAFGGSARVYSGADGSLIRRHDAESPTDNLGRSVAGIGDVDGDGVPDYVAGGPRYRAGTSGGFNGTAEVWSGATGEELFHIMGRPGDEMGTSVAAGGDLDGDGEPDLLIGAIGLRKRGAVLAVNLTGSRPKKIVTVVWPFSGDPSRFGSALASVPDVTGDGLPDIAFGAEGARLAGVLAGDGGLPVFAHFGSSADIVGDAVADGGDMNGDGSPELIVGAWGTSIVRVFSLTEGAPPTRLTQTVDFTTTAAGEGTLTLSVKGKKNAVKLKLADLAPGTYTVFLETGAGSGTFFAVADIEVKASGKGKLTLKAKVFAPAALQVLSLSELAGRRVEIRDGGGAVVLEAAIPEP
jgi:hypothetical protein